MTAERKYSSPGLPRMLLKLMSDYQDNHSIIEDFEETYSEIRHFEGSLKAKCWYWGNTLKTFPEYLKLAVVWRIIMLRNYLKIAYRNLARNKLYSFINIFGLALGLAICILLSLWVQRELGYDRFHEKADRIFRVERELLRDSLYERWPITSGAYKQALIDDFAEIEAAVRIWRNEFAITDGQNFTRRQQGYAVDPSIFEIFDFGLAQGDERTALTEPMTMVLTRENALTYFGTDDVIGRSLALEWGEEKVDFKVTGILKEVPSNSHIHFNLLISISSYPDERFAKWRSNYLYTYVLLRENASKPLLEEKFKIFIWERLLPEYAASAGNVNIEDASHILKMKLFPLTGIHLHPSVNWEIEAGGSMQSVTIFSTIAVFILMIACINFINLSTARANKRAKEVGLRKTVGAGNRQLRAQFVQESAISALISLFIAVMLCSLFIPAFNQIFATQLSFRLLSQVNNLALFLGIALAAGIFSGLYPALYLARFDPTAVLKTGWSAGKGRSAFRNNLVVFQFVISTILIFGMFTVYRQMQYIQTRSLGFDRENVVVIPARGEKIFQGYDSFRSGLLQSPRILSASVSYDLPGQPFYSNGDFYFREKSDDYLDMIIMRGDYDYVETLKLELLAGRGFSREFGTDAEEAVILNEAAVRLLGLKPDEAVGKILDRGDPESLCHIVGIVKNFHFKSLRREVEPTAIILSPDDWISTVAIRTMPGNIQGSLEFIRGQWESAYPGEQFEYTFLGSEIQKLYTSESKMRNLFVVFSSLSIFVACLGLFGLAAYTAEVRTKEIGIRKTLGASSASVTFLMSKEFIKWILIANVIACPLAWFMMNKWLQGFAYRIQIGWAVFFITAAVTFLIAVSTFVFQALKAAWANPVNSLRYE